MQNNKNLKQFKEAKAGVNLFYNLVENANSYNELLEILNNLSGYFLRIGNEKNNRVNKNIIVFTEYFRIEANKKRDIQTVVNNAKSKRLSFKKSYKDYIEDYLILSKRGYSSREIAAYSEKHFKIKVSKTTINNIIKEHKGEN
ncbi:MULTISPECIES: hypothetical protein [Arcobacteraceae]|uniref:Uncharacterized protein n=1 Tax=Aliarcobacter thereius LMG 24486 TaxID=1032240 RepID=A0A1C7WQU5_9BACT|nr:MULTISPECIES: hypothetical protein [Arcobacteraceae]OCL85291.1 hypothetical protein AAX30_01944 [Arcobacter porcinus]OCL95215.1 hypothetical protein AA347_00667 [Aliarcobacter thereius LMG 24486]QBF16795.1 hypothetical protein ATH_1777 [Aliarcobacter thereius LMG 24486]TLS94175.1 hypothetical protein FE244_02565 [Aliarcobacter thereius]